MCSLYVCGGGGVCRGDLHHPIICMCAWLELKGNAKYKVQYRVMKKIDLQPLNTNRYSVQEVAVKKKRQMLSVFISAFICTAFKALCPFTPIAYS